MNCLSRRVAPPITLPVNLEDPVASWKGPPTGPDSQPFPNSGPAPNTFQGPPQNQYQGPSPFSTGPPPGASSPAGTPSYQQGPAGSNTPQYNASPAPSGSSTPGPPSSLGNSTAPFPPPTPNSAGPYNGPSPFGSPGAGTPFGRPNSSGPPTFTNNATNSGPPPPNPHFSSPGQHFGGPQFGLPPGSPFGSHPGHPLGPGHPMMPGQMPGQHPVDRLDQGVFFNTRSLPTVPRRHTPYFGQPDYRVYELNKRLQQRTEESDNLWWDAFATEFFEDDSTLTLTFCLEDGPKRYTIGRTLIPRYFRSIFEGGVSELYYSLKHPKESFHNTSITLDCDQCTMITIHTKPFYTKVCTEGRLILEFTFDDLMRIKSWHFAIRTHRELIPRSVINTQQDPVVFEQCTKNITRQGITNSTLNYLRLCVILEPMQELMSRNKAYSIGPRECLKTTLFQKWQRMVAPPGKRESQRTTNKRRKRKGSNSGASTNNIPALPSKKRSPGPNFSLASQDVMVVGEPSLMGGEFGDEDERLITRLENTQYDAANSLDHESHGAFPGAESPMNSVPNSWGVPSTVSVTNSDRILNASGTNGPSNNNPSSGSDSDKKSPVVSQ